MVRTAPVPLYLLAEQVRANDLTVVITGEGADELFWGYDLFKEVVVRELNQHDPERARTLLEEFYPYLGEGGARRGPAFTRFLLETGSPDDPLGSHLTRVEATATVKAFYRPEVAAEVGEDGVARAASRRAARGVRRLEHARARRLARGADAARALPPGGAGRPRGDGARGRGAVPVPRPPRLRRTPPGSRRSASSTGCATRSRFASVAADLLPEEIVERPKQPYRAPEVVPFFGPDAPEWVEESLSPGGAGEDRDLGRRPRRRACFRRCRAGRATGIREGMALVGILSTQLWHEEFCGAGAGAYPAETAEPRVRIDRSAPSTARGGRMTDGRTATSERRCGRSSRRTSSTSAPTSSLRDGDDFLALGIIDSLGFVELVEEVQSRYGISIDDVEITEENFGSIDAITGFVERKRAAA